MHSVDEENVYAVLHYDGAPNAEPTTRADRDPENVLQEYTQFLRLQGSESRNGPRVEILPHQPSLSSPLLAVGKKRHGS